MDYVTFDGKEFPPHYISEFKRTWKILSPEGRKSFEQLLKEFDDEGFQDFKKHHISNLD